MKRFWNTETRNESNAYYRVGDWGVDRADDWDNGRSNFTDVSPPEAAFNGVPCDWNGSAWVLDTVEEDRMNALAGLSGSDIELIRGIEDLVDTLITKGTIVMGDLPQALQDKITARQALRNDL